VERDEYYPESYIERATRARIEPSGVPFIEEGQPAIDLRPGAVNWVGKHTPYVEQVEPPLERIRDILSLMPYGDYLRFCEATGADPQRSWDWAKGISNGE
jgi:hypothetical protein